MAYISPLATTKIISISVHERGNKKSNVKLKANGIEGTIPATDDHQMVISPLYLTSALCTRTVISKSRNWPCGDLKI